MGRKIWPLLPPIARRLARLGERVRTARRRRALQAKLVAERAGISPVTLRAVERGEATVTMGAYVAVLHVLGLDGDLDAVAADDSLGRALQDADLPLRIRTRQS